MSKPVKNMVTNYLRDRFAGVDSACVVELTGLNARSVTQLRSELRAKSMRLEMVNNSLARRAFDGDRLSGLVPALMGPCALVTSPDSIIEVARELVRLATQYANLKLKSAIIEGDPDLISVADLAKAKSRRELIGEVAMLLLAPARNIAACLASPASKISGCMKTQAERTGEESTDAGPPTGPVADE